MMGILVIIAGIISESFWIIIVFERNKKAPFTKKKS
jgi:hypothetical protein